MGGRRLLSGQHLFHLAADPFLDDALEHHRGNRQIEVDANFRRFDRHRPLDIEAERGETEGQLMILPRLFVVGILSAEGFLELARLAFELRGGLFLAEFVGNRHGKFRHETVLYSSKV